MSSRKEGTVAIVAALFVLFSSMWDSRISIALAILALAALGIYRLVR
jgi:VIT1/CCC1 family predicted Fe2+/Mn2+ transporter